MVLPVGSMIAHAGCGAVAAAERLQRQQHLQHWPHAQPLAQGVFSVPAPSMPPQQRVLVWSTGGDSEQLQGQCVPMHLGNLQRARWLAQGGFSVPAPSMPFQEGMLFWPNCGGSGQLQGHYG